MCLYLCLPPFLPMYKILFDMTSSESVGQNVGSGLMAAHAGPSGASTAWARKPLLQLRCERAREKVSCGLDRSLPGGVAL